MKKYTVKIIDGYGRYVLLNDFDTLKEVKEWTKEIVVRPEYVYVFKEAGKDRIETDGANIKMLRANKWDETLLDVPRTIHKCGTTSSKYGFADIINKLKFLLFINKTGDKNGK